ncbi:MAG: YqjF family protein [Coraliomargarita sp.]
MKLAAEPPKRNWVIAQRWSHVLFLSYPVDRQQLQNRLPAGLEVDTWDGQGWLSIVPFHMSGIRFRGLPSVPFTDLWELNLRTYVRWQDQRGILFFTLDTDSRLGQFIATRLFHLPYRVWPMRGLVRAGRYSFEAKDSFLLDAELGGFVEADPFDRWIADRYSLFTAGKRGLYRGDVAHAPWRLRGLESLELDDRFSRPFGFTSPPSLHARYAEPLDVRFRPFVKLS